MTEVWAHDCPGRVVMERTGDGLVVTCSVDEEPPVVENLIRNGGFDAGTEGWSLNPGTAAVWRVVDGALDLLVTEPVKVVQVFQTGVVLLPNTQYRLTFLARGNEPGGMEIAIHQHATPFADYGLRTSVPLTTSWQEFGLGFMSTAAAAADARLRFTERNTVAGREYWIDDVKLVKVV